MRCWGSSPASPFGLRRGSLRLLRYDRVRLACRAVACEASEGWWSQAGSNLRPLACHASALPAELWPRRIAAPQIGVRAMTLNHSSGPISSLFVTSDITDDISDVLIALFLVGNEGGIVVVIAFDGFVDLVFVFLFGNHGLDLAGILLGVGLLERDQLFGLGGLRHVGSGGGRSGSRGACGIATGGPRRGNRRNRHDLASVGRDYWTLVQVVELLTRRRANTLGSEIGFGHVWILRNSEKRCFTWLVEGLVSIAL